jgi:ABC-type transport system involved in cytochrome bd biosynthesis fused ATPase/permease subunit
LPKEVVAALIALGGVALGAIMTAAFSLASMLVNRRFAVEDRQADHREWYRRTLFEKQLSAVQEGYHWLMRLNRATSQPEARVQGSEQNRAVANLSEQAREWYDATSVFLEDAVASPSTFIAAVSAAGTDLFWKMLIEAEKDLRGRLKQLLESERESKNKGGRERDAG